MATSSIAQTGRPECFFLARIDTSEHDLPGTKAPNPPGRAVDDHPTPAAMDAAECHDGLAEVAELARVHAQLVPYTRDVVEVAPYPVVAAIRHAAGREVRGDREELDLLVHDLDDGSGVPRCERVECLASQLHVRI